MIRLQESHGLRIVDKNLATVRFYYCEENLDVLMSDLTVVMLAG